MEASRPRGTSRFLRAVESIAPLLFSASQPLRKLFDKFCSLFISGESTQFRDYYFNAGRIGIRAPEQLRETFVTYLLSL